MTEGVESEYPRYEDTYNMHFSSDMYFAYIFFFVWLPHVSRIYQLTIVFSYIADLLNHEVRKLSKTNFRNQKFPFLKSANKGFTASQSIRFPICSKEYDFFHEINAFQNLFLEEPSTCMWFGNKM